MIRAEWKPVPVLKALCTARARAAYAWLMVNKLAYAVYIQKHSTALADHAEIGGPYAYRDAPSTSSLQVLK